jgi:hypothetical protein
MQDHDDIILISCDHARVESYIPTMYRLCRRGDEYVLQGRFDWQQGYKRGFDWRDLETVVEG